MFKKITILLTILFVQVTSFGQQVSSMNHYNYNGWEINKGEAIKLGSPDSTGYYSDIANTPTDRRDKQYLKSDQTNTFTVTGIKKFKWRADEEDVYLIIDYAGDKYFVDLFNAVQHGQIIMPAGITKDVVTTVNNSKQYTASNGVTYHIGDKIELGRGSGINGKFNYLKVGGWGGALGGSEQIGSGYSGQKVILKSILYENNKRRDYTKVWMQVGGGNITNYSLEIEQAIQSCEVVPCKANQQISANTIDVADELMKLKKLLDEGILTKEEFDSQKRKLLNK